MNTPRRCGALAITLLAIGCGETAPLPDNAVHRAPIVYGEPSPASEDSVVQVRTPQSTCSGTLIAPNLVVTALHCVSHYTPGNFDCTADGFLVNGGTEEGAIGALSDATTFKIYGQNALTTVLAKGKDVLGTESDTVCRNDLAFIVLDRDITTLPIAPIRLYTPLRLATELYAVGYGLTETGGAEFRSRREVTVTDMGVPPRSFGVGQGPCQGDSGGPALDMQTGAVVGIYSMVWGTCTSDLVRNTYSHLFHFKDLTEKAFARAGKEPWLEGNAGPGWNEGGAGGQAGAAGTGSAGETGSEAGTSGTGGSAGSPPDSDEDGGCTIARRVPGSSFEWALGALAASLLLRRRTRQ